MKTHVLQLAELEIEVVPKDIKNVHLGVYPPNGHVRISIPERMSAEAVHAFLATKLSWIRKEQRKFREQPRHSRPLLKDRESHWVWGERYLLQIIKRESPPMVELGPGWMKLFVRTGSDRETKEKALAMYYRDLVRSAVHELLPTWEKCLGVMVEKVFVRRMKTKWGSCNSERRTIRLNTELAKKPRRCLEYILVHEMIHIHEPSHNARFQALLDRHMPNWREIRDELNRQPLAHEEWKY